MLATLQEKRIDEIMSNAHGTEKYYHRNYCNSLVYTESIYDLQEQCDMAWFVDVVVSHMPAVIKDFQESDNTFFVVEIKTDDKQRAVFTINKEEYDEDGNYSEKNVVLQEIEYVDLPTEQDYKFFLELAQYEPIIFCLMCMGDH